MPGPPPKPDSQRVRRNATVAMTALPVEGYTGPIPAWPLAQASADERERWAKVWRTPMAALWARMGEATNMVVARYVRTALQVEAGEASTVAASNLHAEARQLEDRLGLSPLAMMRLRWEIAPDELGDQRQVKSSTRSRIRAVDTDPAVSEG